MKTSYLARDNKLRLFSVQDAMAIISSRLPGCILTPDDITPEFFDFKNGIAGEIMQKFVNYRTRIAIVLPADHSYGIRVTELAREHATHPYVRFVTAEQQAVKWLDNLQGQ